MGTVVQSHIALIEIHGPEGTLQSFAARYFPNGCFSINALEQTPGELDYSNSYLAKEGYETLFGDWAEQAGWWRFKDFAAKRNYPFPLTTREQVIEAVEASGEDGQEKLRLGRLWHDNLARFGHGHKASWRREHWGQEIDVDLPMVKVAKDTISLSFKMDVVPTVIITRLSKANPDLEFHVYVFKKEPGVEFLMQKGKKKALEPAQGHVAQSVFGFRRDYCLAWYSQFMEQPEWVGQFDVTKEGDLKFKGTEIVLMFALGWLRAKGSLEGIKAKSPAITDLHIKTVLAYAKHVNWISG